MRRCSTSTAQPVGERIEAARRDAVPAPYYDFRPTIETPGFYCPGRRRRPTGGCELRRRRARFGDGAVAPATPLPPFDTPTTDDARGVDPICTLEPEFCPFHAVTLTEALAAGKPVVYYVGHAGVLSTPGRCAPGLESIIEVQPEFGERSASCTPRCTPTRPPRRLSPAVESLEEIGLVYEPVLFITDAAGVVIERIDAVWNTEELVEALNRAVS